jgi:hypothetical protein
VTTDRTRLWEEHPDGEFDTTLGRQFPYSQPGDWVLLADIPHGPKALYVVLYGHVNIAKHGHSRVWPTEASLAAILGATEKTIRKWIVELEKLGAIDVAEVIDPSTGHKRLIYTVHQAAPHGYTGCVDYTAWYKLRKSIKDGLTDSLADVAADDDACTPRKPPVKSTGGNGVKTTGGSDQEEQEPPVKITGSQGSKSTGGQGSKTTGKEEQDKESNSRRPTTTGAADTPAVDNPSPSGGGELPQEVKTEIFSVLRKYLVEICEGASKDTLADDDVKKAIINLAFDCWRAGATVDDIATALAGRIDARTERPYDRGTKGLNALLLSQNAPADPLGPQATPSSWTDPTDGFPYPQLRPDQRECRGASCSDVSGMRYVSIAAPQLGAFSCPICKDHYRKEAAAA